MITRLGNYAVLTQAHLRRISAASRLHLGCISAASRLHLGCVTPPQLYAVPTQNPRRKHCHLTELTGAPARGEGRFKAARARDGGGGVGRGRGGGRGRGRGARADCDAAALQNHSADLAAACSCPYKRRFRGNEAEIQPRCEVMVSLRDGIPRAPPPSQAPSILAVSCTARARLASVASATSEEARSRASSKTCISTASRPHLGRISAVSRPYLGCISAVSRPR